MGNVFQYRMPAGIPGTITRAEHSTVEAGIFNAAKAPASYGIPVKIVSGKIEAIEASDAATVVYGFLVRPYPMQGGQSDAMGAGTVVTSHPGDIMRRGYMMVKNNAGTPAKNGQVYMRIANVSAGKPIGGLEAAAVTDETVAITNCIFTGAADSSGNTEIEFKI